MFGDILRYYDNYFLNDASETQYVVPPSYSSSLQLITYNLISMKCIDIDLGYEQTIEVPLFKRKSISFLLGAGFSAPMGYPIGNDMNNGLLKFSEKKYIAFSPSGSLVSFKDEQASQNHVEKLINIHQKYFTFCKRLIWEYAKTHNNKFDYELFYDFIKSDEIKEKRYQVLCEDLLDKFDSFEDYLFNIPHIYNQMTEYLLKDRNGKNRYDNEPFKINNVEGYNGFLHYLSLLRHKYIINVHTLNHDLLFESFNNTGYINSNISDGFDEFGSEYYGKLMHDNRIYHCRLERYTGRYNTPIRLFKLHGSLDYVPFYKKNGKGFMVPDKYIKIKWGMGAGDIMKSRKHKNGYNESPFVYHADFLTGTTSKIQRYNEPLLFKKLFKRFKKNLRDAEQLIIIGYGCKDKEINEIIKENFDYQNKSSFIIDKYAGNQVVEFGKEINAVIHMTDLDSINSKLFI